MTIQCSFEQDLLDAISSSRWPACVDADLRSHVAACSLCGDVALLAAALQEDRDAAWAEAPVPPASAVWWRAQVRAREEAARLAARPIAVIQAVAAVCVFAASVALAPAASAWVREWIGGLGAAPWWSVPPDVSLTWILGTAAYTTLPILAVGLWLVLAPVLVYLALDER